jgi:signal transduction histidine kinase
MNLIRNAIEAMQGTGGEIKIKSLLGVDRLLLVSISDTGIGLPVEEVHRIFDAFFTTKTRGTGLGLALTRSIIQSHGGKIWAAPNPEAGATFNFALPICEEAA